MKNEAQFKLIFKKSVRAQKGFCLSLAAPMIAGIPDLYVVINGFMPVLLEAKFIKDIGTKGFTRKVEYSEIQKKWITECNAVREHSALGLVGVRYTRINYSAHLQKVDRDVNRLSSTDHIQVEYKDGVFDVIQLFEKFGVPKINGNLIHSEHIGDRVE